MLGTLFLGCLSVVSLLWSLNRFRNGKPDVGAGARAAALVLAGGAAVHAAELSAWMEGGYGMFVLTLLGAYAIGAAVAYRRAGNAGARNAAIVTGGLTLGASGVLYQQALAPLSEILRGMPPEEAERIWMAAREEAARLPQLAIALVLFAGISMITRSRRKGGSLRIGSEQRSGDRVAFAAGW